MDFRMIARVGGEGGADGAPSQLGTDADGGLLVTDLHARFTAPVLRDNVYSACTGVGGVAHGTVLSTTPPFTLFNPLNSGKYAVIIDATLGYVSGTLGAGTIVWCYNNVTTQANPTTGTSLVAVNNLIGNGDASNVLIRQGATLAAVPTIMRPAFIISASLASTAALPVMMRDVVDGSIVVAPGGAISLQGIATAGSTPLVLLAMTWEEIDAA